MSTASGLEEYIVLFVYLTVLKEGLDLLVYSSVLKEGLVVKKE